ncbi:unnamed protein product [Orchesella dallaii]|uniref:AMP-dependent synthetase/ligase domain-containing protein n=1 Tax=Orchesella dallaii TaxID=48710 RepID=A0ABP1PMB2_9HEXA
MASRLKNIPFFEYKTNLVFTKSTHISGAITPFASLLKGIGIVYLTYITNERIFDAVETYKPGLIFGFPTFLLMIAHEAEVAGLDLSNLEIIGSGGAPVTPAVVNALMTIPSVRYVLNVKHIFS